MSRIHRAASGEIAVRIDGGIHIRIYNPHHDLAELGPREARELGQLLIRLADDES
jgi:hypothetical protein